jgi:curved DNA-binding protein CbpA
MPILGLVGLLILGIIISIAEAIFRAIFKAPKLESDGDKVRESPDDGESYASDSVEEEFETTKEREEFERDKEWKAYYRERTKGWEAEQKPMCSACQIFYVKLGLPAEATQAELKQRYRDLCVVWHPDRFEHNGKMRDRATKEFQEIQQAFNHISAHVRAVD